MWPESIGSGAKAGTQMTLVVTVNGPEAIWLLADRRLNRRLSGRSGPIKDDARKLMFLETDDGVAILGYAGLGATALGTEPADWMSAVLRGRRLSVEASLSVLAEAVKRQLPPSSTVAPWCACESYRHGPGLRKWPGEVLHDRSRTEARRQVGLSAHAPRDSPQNGQNTATGDRRQRCSTSDSRQEMDAQTVTDRQGPRPRIDIGSRCRRSSSRDQQRRRHNRRLGGTAQHRRVAIREKAVSRMEAADTSFIPAQPAIGVPRRCPPSATAWT